MVYLTNTNSLRRNDEHFVLDRIITCLSDLNTTELRICFEDCRVGKLPRFLNTPGLMAISDGTVKSIVHAVIEGKPLLLARLTDKHRASVIFVSQ